MLRLAIPLLAGFLLLVNHSNGWLSHSSCRSVRTTLEAAITDAIQVMTFTANQLPGPPGHQGDLFQSIFRADTPALRQQVKDAINNVLLKFPNDPDVGDSTVTFFCGDAELVIDPPSTQRWDNVRQWIHPNVQDAIWINMIPVSPLLPIALSRPCTGNKAITYPPRPGAATIGEGNVIMLCATPFTYPTGFSPRWKTRGRLAVFTQQAHQLITEGQTPAGLDLFSMLTSKTLIHELLHAIDFGSFPAMLSPGVLEAYGVNDIVGLTTAQSLINADSIALFCLGTRARSIFWTRQTLPGGQRMIPNLCPGDDLDCGK